MAPLPAGASDSKEPKAPDKEEKSDLSKKETAEGNPEPGVGSQIDQATNQAEEKEVTTLDEGQLKALLDEAITYKRPKDREGKSELFKELLQVAEKDVNKKSLKIPKNYYNIPKRKHSRHQKECGVGTSTTRGGSLQNLYALGMDGTSRGGVGRSRRSGRGNETLVSARQREGGSLPTNVNAVNNETDLDICPNYTSRAIFKLNEPAKEAMIDSKSEELTATISEATCSPSGADLPSSPGTSTKDLEDASSPSASPGQKELCKGGGPHVYDKELMESLIEERANFIKLLMKMECSEILGGYPNKPNVNGAMNQALQTPMQQHLSSITITPSQINSGSEDHSQSCDSKKINNNYQTVSNQRKATSGDLFSPAPEDDFNAGFLGHPFTTHWNRYSSFTLLDIRDPATRSVAFGRERDSSDKTKSLDENGNALNSVVRLDSFDRQKKRRVKTKNDKNVVMSETIEGFRGGADIDSLINYINSSNDLDSNKGKSRLPNNQQGTHNSHVKPRSKEEDKPIKRRTKEKIQRCTSLEEISKTKLEDLTEESSSEKVNGPFVGQATKKRQVTLDDAQLGKKSTWDSEANLEETSSVSNNVRDDFLDQESRDSIQDSEFHIVTKKQRKKKRRAASKVPEKPVCYGNKGFPAHDRSVERDGSRLLYQYRHGRGSQTTTQPRRKSASSVPPSDKSDTSDLDSVHSLPVASSSSRTKANKSASGGSTPQASYADIARTSASPPVVGSHSPYLSSADPIPSMLPPPLPPLIKKTDSTNCDSYILHKEEYPPLEVIDYSVRFYRQNHKDTHDKNCMKINPVKNVIKIPSENRNSPQPLPVDLPSSHVKPVASSKRPPVILMDDSSATAQAPTELTFGFEVNQQLLCDSDSVCNRNVNPRTTLPLLESARAILAAPQPPPVPLNSVKDPIMRTLIYFLDRSWEEAKKNVREGRGQYYEGQ